MTGSWVYFLFLFSFCFLILPTKRRAVWGSYILPVFDSRLLQGESSSTPVTNTAERLRNTQGGSEGIADAGRPASEPAEVLHACQAQVAELELWLAQAKESLGSEVQTQQMQQAVERHLTACQVR